MLALAACHSTPKKHYDQPFTPDNSPQKPIIDSSQDSVEVPNDTIGKKILSLIFVRDDREAHLLESEVFVFGQVLDDSIVPIEDSIDMADYPSMRKRVLQKYQNWAVFAGGRAFNTVSLKRIDTENYACSRVIVGKGDASTIDTNTLRKSRENYYKVLSGSDDGMDLNYGQTVFLGRNGKASEFNTKMDTNEPNMFGHDFTVAYNNNLKALYHKHNGMSLFNIYNMSINPIVVNGEKYYLGVSTCSDTIKHLVSSMLYLFQMKDNKIVQRDTLFDDLGLDSWGDGFTVLDAEDLKGHGNMEFICLDDQYEVTIVDIIEIKNGKLKVEFSWDLYGC